jgi:23S rRNA pseudouridine955/2504/2580 synthase
MNKKEIIVEKNKKLVTFLQDFGFSFADVNKMLRAKDVKVNGRSEKNNIMLSEGDVVTFFYSDQMLGKKFETVFESDNVLIVYKKAGIETAGANGLEGAISNVIAVHRLDRNTEGLVVFAKNEQTAEKLLSAFKNKMVQKFYLTEVVGDFDCKNMLFEAFLTKNSKDSFVKISDKPLLGSVKIQTKIDTLKHGSQSSVLKVELLTGKTHQIRAHLAFLGHPIIGDGKYGKNEDNKKFGQPHQVLACYKIAFDNVGIDEINGKTFERYPAWWNF